MTDAANEIIERIFDEARQDDQAALVAEGVRELFVAGEWDTESLCRKIQSAAGGDVEA